MRVRQILLHLVLIGIWWGHLPTRAGSQPADDRTSAGHVIVDFLDIGQGDSILIRSPEGKTALVDAGPSRDAALKWLKRKGIETLDLVVVSHHHSDHYGGMDQVIRAYKPRFFVATGSGHTTKLYLKLLTTAREEGVTLIQPTSKTRKIELGSATLTIFPQPPEAKDEENNNSIGLRLQYGDFSVIMTGDSEEVERQWWLSRNPELLSEATILKLAHHGSRNGTDARWLKLIAPELAVASLGKGNDYGHPHSETISLLRKAQVPLLRTDVRGTITIQSDGRTWNLVNSQLARRGTSREREPVQTADGSGEGSSRPAPKARTRTRR